MWSLPDIIAMNDRGELGKRWWKSLKSNFTISFGDCLAKSQRDRSDTNSFKKFRSKKGGVK